MNKKLKNFFAITIIVAIALASFSCTNNSNSSSSNNNSKRKDINFNLSGAKGYFAGKVNSTTQARTAAGTEDTILMKIDENGNISPAMELSSAMSFNIKKLLKNPVSADLYLIGDFTKESGETTYWVDDYDEKGNVIGSHEETEFHEGWHYGLIRVDKDGVYYGLEDSDDIKIIDEPFDKDGNFYFQKTSNIYKYTGNTVTQVAQRANLCKVLYNGAIVYSISGMGLYLKPVGKDPLQLRDALSLQGVNYLETGYGVYSSYNDVYYYEMDSKRTYEIVYDDDWEQGKEITKYYMVIKAYDFSKNKKIEFETLIPEPDKKSDYYNSYWNIYKTANLSSNEFTSKNKTFISNKLCVFEIQDDKSLVCKYSLAHKGYSVAENYVWKENGDEKKYLKTVFDNGNKIYLLGTKGQQGTRCLYKISNFGTPVQVLKDEDIGAYTFNGPLTFAENGDFIAGVARKSDGKFGTLTGNMESGEYEFEVKENFETVTDIIINFDEEDASNE